MIASLGHIAMQPTLWCIDSEPPCYSWTNVVCVLLLQEFSQGALVSLHLARELSQARSAVHACSQPDSAPKSLSWPAPLMAAAEQAMCDETEGATGHSDSVAQQVGQHTSQHANKSVVSICAGSLRLEPANGVAAQH